MSSNVQQIVLMKNVIWLFIFVCFGVLAAIAGDFASSMLGVIFGWYIIISVFRIPVSIFKKRWKKCVWLLVGVSYCVCYLCLMSYSADKNQMILESEYSHWDGEQLRNGVITIRSLLFSSDYNIIRGKECTYIVSASYSLMKTRKIITVCEWRNT